MIVHPPCAHCRIPVGTLSFRCAGCDGVYCSLLCRAGHADAALVAGRAECARDVLPWAPGLPACCRKGLGPLVGAPPENDPC